MLFVRICRVYAEEWAQNQVGMGWNIMVRLLAVERFGAIQLTYTLSLACLYAHGESNTSVSVAWKKAYSMKKTGRRTREC